MLPSGQNNEERGEEVHKEEEGEIEHWKEHKLAEEWEQWEFVGEDDMQEDQEYQEAEEDGDDHNGDEEEAAKENKVPVSRQICVRSVLPEHMMSAWYMVTQDIKVVALNVLQG